MEEERGGPLGPFEDLEVIRTEAGMPTTRFCKLIGMPERTYRRWQAKARNRHPAKGPWPRPAREASRELVTKHALKKPSVGAPQDLGDGAPRRTCRFAGHRATHLA